MAGRRIEGMRDKGMRGEGKEVQVGSEYSSRQAVPRGPSRYFSLSLLFLLTWLLLMVFGRSAMLRDPGSFWHVAAGEKMLSAGQLFREDPFSFTFAGRTWVDDQWLAECGMAVVHRLAGWDGLLLVTATLLAGIYTWIAARLLRGGLHLLPTGLLLALVILLGSSQFHVRPLVLTIGLLGVTFAWLIDVETGVKRISQLWWLAPLFVVWTNMHGGVLGGLGTVGFCAGGWCVAAIGQHRASPAGAFRRVLGLTALVMALAATTLINPYGLALPLEWLETLAMPLAKLIEEHAPLRLTEPIGWATMTLAVGYLAVLVGTFPRRPRVVWLLPLAWLAFTLLRVRNAPLFGVTAAIALADMLPHSRVGRWLARRDMFGLPGPAVGRRWIVFPLAVVAASALLQVADLRVPVVGRGWVRFDSACWPVEMLPKLDELNRSSVEGTPLFNDLNQGGFLMYHTPRLRVFIDDRCSLYGTAFLTAYDRARRVNPAEIGRWQQRYGFRHALVTTGGPFDRYLADDPQWVVLCRAPAATLYECR